MENQHAQRGSDVKLGRFLSLVLRHNPDAAGMVFQGDMMLLRWKSWTAL